jgi:hypothetical protein
MKSKGLKLSEIDPLGVPALHVVEGKATPAIHFNPRGALNMQAAVAGQSEFQYQV